jgi:hypothetical protein
LEPARLIPVSGIKGQQETEERATSALLAVLGMVRSFSAAVLAETGATRATTARVEAFTEPAFEVGDRTLKPDGLIRVHVGKRIAFAALVEVKTGHAKLDADQINAYLDVARRERFDAVITISNEIAPSPGVHPTGGLAVRANSKVRVHHLSWTLIVSEATKEHVHRGVDDPEQAWVLSELIRYLTHPKSGVVDFADMGESWPQVRDEIAAGTLNRSDKAAMEVCQRWDQLLRVIGLRLSTETGADVLEVIPKAHRDNPRLRSKEFLRSLCETGTITGVLRVPAAAGDMTVTADIRASIVEVSASLSAPDDGTPRAAVVWLVKQLRDAPDSLIVDTYPKNSRASTSESLERLRLDPRLALGDYPKRHPGRFRIRQQSPMGAGRRSTRKKGFIDSVIDAVIDFYAGVIQDISPYTPKAPHMPRPSPTPAARPLAGAAAETETASGPAAETPQLAVEGLSVEERRALADRTEFPLDLQPRRAWEEMNAAPARDLPDLREFMQKRSPHVGDDDPPADTPHSSGTPASVPQDGTTRQDTDV